MKKALLVLLLVSTSLFADAIYSLTLKQNSNTVYNKLMASLADNHLVVVSEIDILAKFKQAGLPAKFADEFNTNNLTAIKAIIACNGYFGNYISNEDPKMMALCPIRITLYEKAGETTIVYVKPTSVMADTKASEMIVKLEAQVIKAIEAAK